ncbi:MAG: glycosyltransferase family 25 protein [Alphaproteobacteria bacterium]|nr:glycosyltransferase family 25 protein [Alphaproteobacteria bacterium]
MTLPVFVINLDRRPDRWEAMSAQLDRLGIAATRIPAVNGRLLAAQEEREQGTSSDPPGSDLSLGEVACAWSHRKALRALLDTGERAALILEDDAELAPDTPSLLESVDWWPPDARVIRVETGIISPKKWFLLWPASAETPSGRRVHRFERWAPGSAAYLVNREAAAFALPHFDNPAMPMDTLLFDHRRSRLARELRALQIVPGAARQTEDGETSDLAGWRPRGPRHTKWGKHNKKSLLYRARLIALRCTGKVKKQRQGVYYRPAP